jgi:hypothetical protein
MSSEDTGFADETAVEEDPKPRKVRARKPVFRVRKVSETGEDPTVTKFDTKELARRYVETNHPRGREVYVEHPDGYAEHFSGDLANQGHESGGWQELTDEEVE